MKNADLYLSRVSFLCASMMKLMCAVFFFFLEFVCIFLCFGVIKLIKWEMFHLSKERSLGCMLDMLKSDSNDP